ncbi:Peptidoglycan deacetylase [Pseudovibrio sp. Ad46]|uniref:polysaccharide deacetylase family protein n=1 Tax=unclassified Pseudovibrio TaxID=2627060 RepID=UPI0007AE4876|nr:MULTISPECIES: polysaccharide deacetylase [unclassified Pseudovibrio]KZK84463.1 Peptidoglycan deacetylase [Pseudovibrio sp. Ad46]KZK95222.1 Peptidoglycan deacetylase [Pseudovibrio sp. W74]KZK96615.1 Peptidoglycan deacetylase [Pseudovibrio sp. Ad5]KZL05073.1 Peptidoglycan deacetylase [Pseudovibrio sp. Ad14]
MIQNPIVWPNGARCACAITFDVDADSLIHISRPKDGFDRLYPISMGRYGPTVALPRILDTYRRLGLKQSFFVPGWVVEQYPEAMDLIQEDGHEIGHHGYLHEDPTNLSDAEHRYWFERALEAHKKTVGNTPKGYRAPVYNASQGVIDFLVDNDFLYDSSLMADDIPYRIHTAKGSLVELPVHWGTDDWPPFAHYSEIDYMMPVAGPSRGLEGFWEEFEAQYEHGGFWMAIWHPFLTGRLARWTLVERWLETILERGDIWFAPLHEIAEHVNNQFVRDNQSIRVEELPYYNQPVHLGAK